MRKIGAWIVLVGLMGCKDDSVDCGSLVLRIVTQHNPTSCSIDDGSITVAADGGASPFLFEMGNQSNTSGSFENLENGNYTLKVTDRNGCSALVNASMYPDDVKALSASVTSIAQNDCDNPNGSISIQAKNGTPPYKYSIGSDSFVSSSIFSGLMHGDYEIQVRDSGGCTYSNSVNVDITCSGGPG